ncbi:MAG TPA: cytochrome c [Gammaproteobacteria bacterium]|jgi:mono/diheme cytochrome c family protein
MQIAFRTLLAIAAVTALAVVAYAYSAIEDVAASRPEGAVTGWLLTTIRDRSIERRASGIKVPPLDDPKLIAEGFGHYHEMCTGCHLAPGIDSSEIRAGLNPQPPVLAEIVPNSNPARLFWVIKNGVKMTGMPAWGASHSDGMIWAMVAFLEKLPGMTPAQYQAMEKQALQTEADGEGGAHSHHHR